MVTTKLNLSMTEPQVRQIYAKQGDTGRVLDISLDQTPEDGTLRILRPDGVEVTSEAVTGGEVESGGTFESLTEADVTELTVGIEPVQDLSHGDPSPTIICPITGHDEVRVTQIGRNLCAPRDMMDSNIYNAGHLIPVTQEETIYVYGEWTYTQAPNLYGRVFDDKNATNKNADGANPRRNSFASETVVSMTMPQSGYFGVCYSSRVAAYTINKMMVSREPITSYEPYRSNTYTTSLGQTVYGGTLDMVSGVLTVTHGNIASYNGETLPSTWISDRDVYASGTTPTTGAQVVYELATPLTYQLTAQQIKTLVGTNNVWASSGDIVNIKFTYGGLLSELPSDATEIVGKCYCDVEQNGVSSMPFTLNVKKNERQ